jgi:hypothetical protein
VTPVTHEVSRQIHQIHQVDARLLPQRQFPPFPLNSLQWKFACFSEGARRLTHEEKSNNYEDPQ